MKAFSVLALLSASLAWTQTTASPAPKGDTVIAIDHEDGEKITVDRLTQLLAVHPSWQQYPPEQVIHEYCLLKKAMAAAKTKSLDQKDPYKKNLQDAVEFASMYSLADAWAQDATSGVKVTEDEIQNFYDHNKDPFKIYKVSGILISFGGDSEAQTSSSRNASTKKALTEEQAQAKAEDVAKQVRGGADFGKMVLLYSDDVSSKQKGGDQGEWDQSKNVPDQLRAAVFSLKEGEVSDPLRQGSGFWLLHVDKITYKPLDSVRDLIFDQLKKQKIHDVLSEFEKTVNVEMVKQNDPAPAPQVPSSAKH